jgi:hypothetical protein
MTFKISLQNGMIDFQGNDASWPNVPVVNQAISSSVELLLNKHIYGFPHTSSYQFELEARMIDPRAARAVGWCHSKATLRHTGFFPLRLRF